MKMLHTLAAALLTGMANNEFRQPRSVASGNRLHTNRARPGSVEHREALERAEAKRARKNAKRASQSSGGDEHG